LGKGLGSLAAFAISFALIFNRLPQSYEKIVGWLAPVFGKMLRITFTSLYLLLGDPLIDYYLLGAWAAAAFIGGFLAKKLSSGILAGLSAYGYNFPILGYCIFKLFESFGSLGFGGFEGPSDLGGLPPFPPDTSLADLLGAPVISDFVDAFISGMAAGGPPDMNALISLAASIILPKILKNLVLIAVCGAVGGYVRSKLESRK